MKFLRFLYFVLRIQHFCWQKQFAETFVRELIWWCYALNCDITMTWVYCYTNYSKTPWNSYSLCNSSTKPSPLVYFKANNFQWICNDDSKKVKANTTKRKPKNIRNKIHICNFQYQLLLVAAHVLEWPCIFLTNLHCSVSQTNLKVIKNHPESLGEVVSCLSCMESYDLSYSEEIYQAV